MKKSIFAAQWFLENNHTFNPNSLDGHLKVQKLLYYAQAMSLVGLGEPLFDEKIEAWENGPVVPDVYKVYRHHNLPVVTTVLGSQYTFEKKQEQLLKIVDYVYGNMCSDELVNQTHSEDPWKDLEHLALIRCNPEITIESMRKYYIHLSEIYEAYKDYDFDSEVVESINGVRFAYNRHETVLEQNDIEILQQISSNSNNCDSYFVYKDDNGELVVY